MSIDAASAVKSADRILELFEALARHDDGLSHQALAEALSIPKSSLTKLLQTAIGRGFVTYSSVNKQYRLGERFAIIAQSMSRVGDIATVSIPVLEDLTGRTRESSAVNVQRGDQAEVVATVSGRQRLVTHMRLGDLAPLYATSGGKIILAFMSAEEREQYLKSVSFERITPKTCRTVTQLQDELEKVREDLIAYSFEEFTPGIVGMASPILSLSGHSLGSLNIAMPAVRFNDDVKKDTALALAQASAELTRRMAR